MFRYSLIVALSLLEYLIHPYGPIAENIPILVATLIVIKICPRCDRSSIFLFCTT